MEAYTSFAKVYDAFMDDVPYEEWAGYLHRLLQGYGIAKGLVLDLGCGTGSLTEAMAARGYDMIGADISPEMLGIAMDKKRASGHDILYLLQDMREFELYGTVRAVLCACDSVNYILNPEELAGVFRLVNNYLDPSGIFLFDFNTEYKYREILGQQTFAGNTEAASYIWENDYEEESGVNAYGLTLFIREEDGRYGRYQETHLQKAYTLEEMRRILTLAGMEFVAAYDGYTMQPPHARSERISVVARERGKAAL